MNFGSGAGGGGGGNAVVGSDLESIDTEQLAFQAASGEEKLRLLPSPWPSDNLPATTSSLLSIASTKGLVAAAGPESIVVAKTQSLRSAFVQGTADGNKIKPLTPEVTLQTPRVSQVVFASDESCLAIAAEQGGGLAVYDTNALMSQSQQPAFQLATEGQTIRQLLPNPNPVQELARYFGVVTHNGQLLMADLMEQKLVRGANGSVVFHEKVTCACWSRLGKQIIAGLADGTAVQIDQQGIVKSTIPEPPQLAEWKDASATAHPVTSILWLETHDFLIIHTPINESGSGGNDDSIYHLAHRDKNTSTWTFSRFNDPCLAFGMERKPAQHFVQRLRDWLDLSDLLVLSSTASADIGMFTRSKTALDPQNPVIDAFTCTQPPDSRRAAMPMSADGDTSPIGMGIDLSVQEKVPRPIPTDETLEQSPIPLPALYVLDNEGLLSMWYIVYNEAVRQAKPYPDLVAAGGPRPLGDSKAQQSAAQTTTSTPSANPSAPPFGQSQMSSAFGSPSQPVSRFGQPSAPTFGGSSSLGLRTSPWGGASTSGGDSTPFKQPAFGSSTFGQAGGMGANKTSVWGTAQSPQPPSASTGGSVFGGNAAQSSPFLNLGNQSGGQSSFANLGKSTQSPFAAAAKPNTSSGSSIFGSGFASKENQPSPFASSTTKPSLSAEPSGSTVSFGNGTSFGSGGTNFGISSFQNSPTPTPQQTQSREESMADEGDEASQASAVKAPAQSTGATGTGAGLFGLGNSGFKLGSTFKSDGSAKDDLPKPKDAGAGLFGKSFSNVLGLGQDSASDNRSAAEEQQSNGEAALMSGKSTPIIKKEPGTEDEPSLKDIPIAEPIEDKATSVDDAPLPPDPTTWKPKPGALPPPIPPGFEEKLAPADDAPLPPDPTTWKPKEGALPPPIPPGFGLDFAKPAQTTQGTPFSFASAATTASTTKKEETSKPIAGSPPVDLGNEKFSEGQASAVDSDEAEGPPESDDGEDEWSDEEEEGEEEYDDDDEDEEGDDEFGEDEENRTPQIVDTKGLSAFEARLTPASPKRGEQQKQAQTESTTPATGKKDSYTPAGLPKAPIMFPPPQRTQASPRSPSPQRSATSPARAMPPTFGSSQPALASKGTPLSKPGLQPSHAPSLSQNRSSAFPAAATKIDSARSDITLSQSQQHPQRISVPPSKLTRPEKTPAQSAPVASQQGELEDEEDARIQAVLMAPIEAIREVPSFLAHQEYVADGREKDGLGGQIEKVFRDINSMVDTLALNARALQGFIKGNSESTGDRSRLDLEEDDDWALCETGGLDGLLQGIEVQLEDGRLEDAHSEISSLLEDEKEVNRLRNKTAEARKQIAIRSDPDHLAQQHAAALPLDSQVQQSEIRQGVQSVQKLLASAEEKLSLLRVDLASMPRTSGSDGKSNMPTVEAVMNTVLKMTAMIEKKSGDIDVLESQIKKLGGPAILGLKAGYEDDLAASTRATGLSSPAAFRGSRASMYGSPTASKLHASRSTPDTAFRKSLLLVSDADVDAYRAKKEARRKAMHRLREQLETRGPRVVKVGQQ